MTEQAAPAKASIHDAGKQKRRERIVAAAATLIRALGPGRLTVAAIAARAGVSPATIYNLFGTKSAVLAQVFEQDMAQFEIKLAKQPSRDGIDRILRSVKLAASLYEADPAFYKALVYSGDNNDLYEVVSRPRSAFYRKLAQSACDDGSLVASTNADALGIALSQLARGVIGHWAGGGITVQRLEDEMSYGFALLLRARANEYIARRLDMLASRLEAKLKSKTRAPVPADPKR